MRVLKKEYWPYKVTYTTVQDDEVVAVDNWMHDNIGKCRELWNAVYFNNKTDYYFKNEKDATFFSLRWL